MKQLLFLMMLICFPLSALSQTQYFDADGNSVSETEYQKIKAEWHEYLLKNKKKPNVIVRYVKPTPTAVTVAPEPILESGERGTIPESLKSDSYGVSPSGGTYDDLPSSGSPYPSGGAYKPHQDERITNKLRLLR